ncbi:hypothetical protein [Nostoc sp.]
MYTVADALGRGDKATLCLFEVFIFDLCKRYYLRQQAKAIAPTLKAVKI